MRKTTSVVVKETGKVELEVHITDNQSWNSCRKVASDHEFTFGSAKEPTKKKERKKRRSIMHFDRALYMATCFSQNMVPLRLGCTGQ